MSDHPPTQERRPPLPCRAKESRRKPGAVYGGQISDGDILGGVSFYFPLNDTIDALVILALHVSKQYAVDNEIPAILPA